MSLLSHSYIRPLIYLFFLGLFIYGVVFSIYLCLLFYLSLLFLLYSFRSVFLSIVSCFVRLQILKF